MEKDEKMLPLGEPTLHLNPPALPERERGEPPAVPGAPSAKQQSWGVVISIIIIILMIVIGAFYSWGKRITEQNVFLAPTTGEE